MKTPHIIRIPILPFNMVNAHLIQGPGGYILVDTGLPGSESRIAKTLAKNRLSFTDILLSEYDTLDHGCLIPACSGFTPVLKGA